MVAARDSSVVRLSDHEVAEVVADGEIHVEPGELEKLIRMLAARGLVESIEARAVLKFKGKIVTSGLFGVEKRGEFVSESVS